LQTKYSTPGLSALNNTNPLQEHRAEQSSSCSQRAVPCSFDLKRVYKDLVN
jgi:hypothetical protein